MPGRYNSYRSSSYPNYKPRSLRRTENKARSRLALTVILSIIFLGVFVIWGLPAFIGGLQLVNKATSKSKAAANIEDEAIAPPTLNIPFDATNSATIKISGFSTPNSKVEIYFDDELKTIVPTNSEGNFDTDYLELALGRNNIYGRTLNDSGKKSLPSKTIRLSFSNEKPQLSVDSPSDGQQISGGDRKVTVNGKTDPQNSITVNGTKVIVSGDGSYQTIINLNDGENIITVAATDIVGNTNQIEKKVTYTPS